MVATVELDAVSIRCTLSSASFETHNDPSPSATPLGRRPTVIAATTLTVLGFIRETELSKAFATQTDPSPTVMADGEVPATPSVTSDEESDATDLTVPEGRPDRALSDGDGAGVRAERDFDGLDRLVRRGVHAHDSSHEAVRHPDRAEPNRDPCGRRVERDRPDQIMRGCIDAGERLVVQVRDPHRTLTHGDAERPCSDLNRVHDAVRLRVDEGDEVRFHDGSTAAAPLPEGEDRNGDRCCQHANQRGTDVHPPPPAGELDVDGLQRVELARESLDHEL